MTAITTQPATDIKTLDKIVAALKEGRTFFLSGHQNPDPDVVGSQLALASLIRRLGPEKRVTMANSGNPPKMLSFLDGWKDVQNLERANGEYDVIIVFECSGADRMGNIIDFARQGRTVINIDHHLHNPNFGHINFVEPHTSSTAELIFKIFQRSGLPIQKNEAMAMYCGMVADTGWFRYGNTTAQTQAIASELLAAGVPVAELSERFFLHRSPAAIKLLAWCLTHMETHCGGKVAIMTIPEEIYSSFGASPEDTEEIVNYGLQIDSVKASALLKEKKNPSAIKVSLRSKGDCDINQVARVFGGGGHKNASGCTFMKSLAESRDILLSELSKVV